MRRNLGIIVALIAILTASCTQYVYIPIHTGGSSGSGVTIEASDVPSKIPEALLATYGLETDKTKLPEGVEVEQKIVPADAADTGSTIAFSRAAASPKAAGMNLVATIKLTNYSYGGATFNSEGIVITYPATETSTGSITYTVNEFTISSEKVEVAIIGVDETFSVAIKETAGKLQDDTASAATPVTVTASSTVSEGVESIENVPQSSTVVMDSWTGSYEVDNEEVSKPASEGMTGAADEPYRISTLDDLAKLHDLFKLDGEVNIALANDLTIDSDWINVNLQIGGVFKPFTVESGHSIVFDFNGKTITYEDETDFFSERLFEVKEGGSLTVNNGADKSIEAGGVTITTVNARGVFNNYGTLVVNGGRYHSVADSNGTLVYTREGGNTTLNNGSFINTSFDTPIYNLGTTVINDGYYYSNSNNSSDRWKYSVITDGEMTINGGEFHGIQGAISLRGGNCIINDAEVYVADNPDLGYTGKKAFYAVYISGEATPGNAIINGGYFESENVPLWVGNSNPGGDGGLMLNATATVNGGHFVSTSNSYDVQVDYNVGSLTLAGGTFVHNSVYQNNAPAEADSVILDDFVEGGYEVQQNPETQLYEVVKAN